MSVDYRKNLIDYWQQFYPNWSIPIGFHVHHIKPKCTFENKDDPRIHHPSNLIALHPDDHYTIHRLRGDTRVNTEFFEYIRMQDRKLTAAHKANISTALNGKKKPSRSKQHCKNLSLSLTGRKLSAAHIANATAGHTGIKFSEEAKARMSVAQFKLNKVNSAESRLKMSKAKTGLKWFNNGSETKMCFPGEEPDGFILGRGKIKGEIF